MDLGLLRKITLEKAKKKVIDKGVVVYRDELKLNIQFSMSGLKECIHQPCSSHIFLSKIDLIAERLEISLKTSEYIGFTEYQTHPKPHILGYHYFKTQIEDGTPMYFNVQLTVQGKLVLYSITEKIRDI